LTGGKIGAGESAASGFREHMLQRFLERAVDGGKEALDNPVPLARKLGEKASFCLVVDRIFMSLVVVPVLKFLGSRDVLAEVFVIFCKIL